MGVRSSIVEFASAQAAFAGVVREKAEHEIKLADMFFEKPTLGSFVMRDVAGLYEGLALSIGTAVTPNIQTVNEDIN